MGRRSKEVNGIRTSTLRYLSIRRPVGIWVRYKYSDKFVSATNKQLSKLGANTSSDSYILWRI